MKVFFTGILSAFFVFFATVSNAQYSFTSTLGPYIQNFDGMGTAAAGITFSGGSHSSIPGIISGYAASGTFVSLGNVKPNDGTTTSNAAYNFGASGATDRALGGIAGGTSSGTGYICLRLRNTSGVTIKNLDVRYAIEQWYNTAKNADASFQVAYRKYANTTSFTNNDIVATTNWTDVPGLNLDAPATGGVLGPVDGNSTTYRRTAQQRLLGVNMANNTEIVIRLTYIFNSNTNGNGISVDDIAVYPETNILYSNTAGNLNETASWWQDAAATTPATSVDFTAANTTYYVQGSNSTSRLSGSWQVTGSNARVVVGTDAAPATLYLAPGDNMTASVDVSSNSTLQIADRFTGTNLALTLGSLATGSTVQYMASGTQNVLAGNYSNLTLGGISSAKFPKGAITVANTLTLSQAVSVGSYNLVLLRGATLNRSAGGQVVTNGTGDFRQTVLGAAAAAVLFPMATSSTAADYLPVTITTGSADKDETYRVRVINNVYTSYTRTGTTQATYVNTAGATTAATSPYLNATWYINHETSPDVAATLKFGWVGGTSREGSSFADNRAQAYVDHYTNTAANAGSWDANPANQGVTSESGLWTVQRAQVSSFSPFAVTFNPTPLPVVLTSFGAKRSAAGVVCQWTTASELRNDYFEVERSLNGKNFTALGTVAGYGSTAVAHAYAFTDVYATASLAYYRLRQVDVGGKVTYSPLISVAGTTTDAPTVVALPNPSTDRFALLTNLPAQTQVHGTVLNLLGQPVAAISQQAVENLAALSLDLSNQPAGIYLVQLLTPNGCLTTRLVKQ